VYTDMEKWATIRRRVLVEGVSKRQILRETGLHWTTLEKILAHSEPPGYRAKGPRPRPKVGPYLDRIRQILEADQAMPRKQRHTAKRIFERLKDEGYRGGVTQVKAAVREIRQRRQEVFVPLVHRPGEAQVDVGHALVKQDGVLRKVVFVVFVLPHSDALFLQVFERSCLETFGEAHNRAFAFIGGVPSRITYDNDGVVVAGVLNGRERRLTEGFLRLKSHYLFDTHFCHVRRANEKGVVESMVKYARLNFLVPVPEVGDLEALNAALAARCRADLARRLRGKASSKGTLLREDQAAFLPMPATSFEACRTVSTTASSLSLVRFEGNDYSVPVRYAHHPVVVKGFVDRVVMSHQGQVIASHCRLWTKEDVSFDPVHYLALLERKPGAFDHARPLADWRLPACFGVLRRRLEDERSGEGTREYIRVLRLLEDHALPAVTAAVEAGLRINALTRDAIAQWLLPREDWRQTTFRLDGREHLRQVTVGQTDVTAYTALLATGGAP
jgi:transposase